MDTLSRKHRLRLRQQQQQQQQQPQIASPHRVTYGKENQRQQFEDFETTQSSYNFKRHYNANNNHSNNKKLNSSSSSRHHDNDHEQFKVFRFNSERQPEEVGERKNSERSLYDDRFTHVRSESRQNMNVGQDEFGHDEEQLCNHKGNHNGVKDEEEFSIVYNGPRAGGYFSIQAASNATNGECVNGASIKSNGYSSGFLSESSNSELTLQREAIRDSTGSHFGRQNHETKHNVGSGSRLIEDLDRLIANSNCRQTTVSPTESCFSCSDTTLLKDSTLVRGNEYDYSTLCREDFSSFIAIEQQNRQQQRQQTNQAHHEQITQIIKTVDPNSSSQDNTASGGPVLIGLHDEMNASERLADINANNVSGKRIQNDKQFSLDSESDVLKRMNCFTDQSPADEQSEGKHSMSDEFRQDTSQLSKVGLRGCSLYDSSDCYDDNLSQMLDIYLERVESLLRLSAGDKSVSMKEAFDDCEIKVSDEHRTKIEFLPIERPNRTQVIQELSIEEENEDEDEHGELSDIKRMQKAHVATNIVTGDFRSLLAATPQTSPLLNWDGVCCEDFIIGREGEATSPLLLSSLSSGKKNGATNSLVKEKETLKSFLEESLICKMLKSNQRFSRTTNSESESLVRRTVKRHLSEFIENYSAYQSELKAKFKYASDWRQNWLFAFKRPNGELSSDDEKNCPLGRATSENSAKRAKFLQQANEQVEKSEHMSSEPCREESLEPIDLIRYSTLILHKRAPLACKLIHFDNQQQQRQSDKSLDVDQVYEAQEELKNELSLRVAETSQEIDACYLLLNDDLCDEVAQTLSTKGAKKFERKKRALLVSYNSSSVPQCDGKYRFIAYGYLFELPISKQIACKPSNETKLAHLKLTILDRLVELLNAKPNLRANRLLSSLQPQSSNKSCSYSNANQEVRFLVNLTNVELVNELPVIQFCAKISGQLPISVRWFRSRDDGDGDDDVDEVSDVYSSMGAQRKSLRLRRSESCDIGSRWPLAMQANYDFEYQNKWSSWFRFRRDQGDLVFEIRQAIPEHDYNRTYRCVIGNHCSQKECSFTLKRRHPIAGNSYGFESEGLKESKPELGHESKKGTEVREDKRALLRTWSQRTLHRPVPSTSPAEAKPNCGAAANVSYSSTAASNRKELPNGMKPLNTLPLPLLEQQTDESSGFVSNKSWQQSVGRRSINAALDGDKFGRDFPYHPENLIKRLEENKFSSSIISLTKCKLNNHHNNQSHQNNNNKQPPKSPQNHHYQIESQATSHKPTRAKTQDTPQNLGMQIMNSAELEFGTLETATNPQADQQAACYSNLSANELEPLKFGQLNSATDRQTVIEQPSIQTVEEPQKEEEWSGQRAEVCRLKPVPRSRTLTRAVANAKEKEREKEKGTEKEEAEDDNHSSHLANHISCQKPTTGHRVMENTSGPTLAPATAKEVNGLPTIVTRITTDCKSDVTPIDRTSDLEPVDQLNAVRRQTPSVGLPKTNVKSLISRFNLA